jgi:hypothetical protein
VIGTGAVAVGRDEDISRPVGILKKRISNMIRITPTVPTGKLKVVVTNALD